MDAAAVEETSRSRHIPVPLSLTLLDSYYQQCQHRRIQQEAQIQNMELKTYSDFKKQLAEMTAAAMSHNPKRCDKDCNMNKRSNPHDGFSGSGNTDSNSHNRSNKRMKVHDQLSPLALTSNGIGNNDANIMIDGNDVATNPALNNSNIPFAPSNWWKKGNDHIRALMTTTVTPMSAVATNSNSSCDISCSSTASDNDSNGRPKTKSASSRSPGSSSFPSPITMPRTPPRDQEPTSWLQLLGEVAASGDSRHGMINRQDRQTQQQPLDRRVSQSPRNGNRGRAYPPTSRSKPHVYDNMSSFITPSRFEHHMAFNKQAMGRTHAQPPASARPVLDPSIFSMDSAGAMAPGSHLLQQQQLHPFALAQQNPPPFYSTLNFHISQQQAPRQPVSPPGALRGEITVNGEVSPSPDVERDLEESYQEDASFGGEEGDNGSNQNRENKTNKTKDNITIVVDDDDLIFSDIVPMIPRSGSPSLKVEGFDCDDVGVDGSVDAIVSSDSSSDEMQSSKEQNSDANKSDMILKEVKFRAYQAENWTEKFEELLQFRTENGHCLVPNCHPENPALAQWTKRQRYQYKLKQEGKRSTITDERVQALEEAGFVWDSHKAVWAERLEELKSFKKEFHHCNVPSRYQRNHQLAIWVKRQRRQWKNKMNELPHCMTDDRQEALEAIGFVWDMKKEKKQKVNSSKKQVKA